eukprot:260054_1
MEAIQIVASYYHRFRQLGWNISYGIDDSFQKQFKELPLPKFTKYLIKMARSNPTMRQGLNKLVKDTGFDKTYQITFPQHAKKEFDFFDLMDKSSYLMIEIAP